MSSGWFKMVPTNNSYIHIYIYIERERGGERERAMRVCKEDLALNNSEELICDKTQPIIYMQTNDSVILHSVFNGIPTFVDYLMPKPSF